MIDCLTQLAGAHSYAPATYEFQKAAIARGLIKSKKGLQQFRRTELGVAGENQFHKLLHEFGAEHWVCLRNIWLNQFSDFECDFILVTHHCVYVFEIKNYFGKFVYQNGQCSSRGTEITYNPINQAHNATLHLRNITKSFSNDIPVRGVLVFIGEHNSVHIKEEIDYIDIVRSNEVYQYIEDMKKDEREKSRTINVERLIPHYETFEIENPHTPIPYSHSEIRKARIGTYCDFCSQSVRIKRGHYVSCRCGFEEYKHRTIVRTACEFGVLTSGRDFVPTDIRNFIDNQVSTKNIRKILNKYFEPLNDAKVLTFRNPGRAFSQISSQFTFDLPNFFRYSNE